MNDHSSSLAQCYLSRLLAFLVLATASFGLAPRASAVTDPVNMSVWKMIYGVTDTQANSAAWLAADDDGDGITNGAELAAGTNPFKPNSTLVVASMSSTTTTVSLTFPTVGLKLYTVQATDSLNPISWQPVAGVSVIGNGSSKTLTVTKNSWKYFRVVVQDNFTVSDGVSDWAKQFLGYALGSSVSSQSVYDSNSLATALGTQNVVTIAATDPSTVQPLPGSTASDLGQFTITRSGYFLFSSITVPITVSGNAVGNTDYTGLPASVTFAPNVKSMVLYVTPINSSQTTNKTVTVALQSGGGYTLGSPSTASVVIYPADNTAGTGLTGNYYNTSSTTFSNIANFGGAAATYTYTNLTPTTGTAVITYTGTPAATFTVGSQVDVSFTSGNLSAATLYDRLYTIAALTTTPTKTITVNITGTALPASQVSAANATLAPFNAPTLTRLDPTVDYIWNTGMPTNTALPTAGSQNWSGQFDGYITPPLNGGYDFDIQADDGARVYVNGVLVIDAWTAGSSTFTPKTTTSSITFTAGTRALIHVDYYQLNGTASFNLRWKKPGDGAFSNIPTTSLFLDNSTATQGLTANYWTNTSFTGLPRFGEYPVDFNRNWGTGQPSQVLPAVDNFSIRWEGYVGSVSGGTYNFASAADDGATVYIDLNQNGTFDGGSETVLSAGTNKSAVTVTVASPGVVSWVGHGLAAGTPVNFTTTGALPGGISANTIYYVASAGLATDSFEISTTIGGTALNTSGTQSGVHTAMAFNTSSSVTLAAGQRYKMRVDFTETTGNALVSLGWKLSTGTSYGAINASAVQTGTNLSLYRDSGATTVAGWWASYFNNSTLTAPPVYSVQDTSTSAIFGSGYNFAASKPGTSNLGTSTSDNWSARWDGYLNPSASGNFTFRITADDGARVYVNNVLIIDAWTGFSGVAVTSGNVALTAGTPVPIRVEYNEITGNSSAVLAWTPPLSSLATIPAVNFFQDAAMTIPGLTGTYWTNTAMFGTPSYYDNPTQINFNYGSGQPGSTWTVTDFSATWDGYLQPSTTGTYQFDIQADDGARVFLDINQDSVFQATDKIIDAWTAGSSTAAPMQSTPYTLTAGQRYKLHVDFFDATGPAVIKLRWLTPTSGGNFAAIPNTNIYRDATTSQLGLLGTYYSNTTLTPPFFYAVGENNSSAITYDFGAGRPDPSLPFDGLSVRWTGQLLPQYSETYFFDVLSDDGCRLWINGQLVVNSWTSGRSDRVGSIALQAGVRYDVVLEYLEINGAAEVHLQWYSNSQPKQPVPMGRLFPTVTGVGTGAAETQITSPINAVALLNGGSFTYTPTASNGGGSFTYTGLPGWLTNTNGVLTGTPPAAGIYQFTVTASNAAGAASSIVTINVIDAGAQVTRDLWNSGITTFASFSTASPNTSGNVPVSVLEDNSVYPDNSGERLRGYIIPPTTGNYYFWVSANNAAQLWISNDSEPVNKVLRSTVNAPGTASRVWSLQTNQKSGWLSLVAGQRYYYEVLHICPVGSASDNVAVGYFLDPTGNTVAPIVDGSGAVPGYMLSPFDNPPTTAVTGNIYICTLNPVSGVSTPATGGAYLRLNAAQTQAILHFSYGGLTSGELENAKGLYRTTDNSLLLNVGDANKLHPGDPNYTTSDGGYVWNVSAQNVADLLANKVYFKVSTFTNPGGEISGVFGYTAGSQAAPAAPAVPAWTDDSNTDAGASRFLSQATFGPSPADVTALKNLTASGAINPSRYRTWIDNQLAVSASHIVPDVLVNLTSNPMFPYPSDLFFNSWWKNAISAPDQLRHRMAFALSEIMVVSDNNGNLQNNARTEADYYDTLLDGAFGNFRSLLETVTLTSSMGLYLDMRANDLGDISVGRSPNENYAREIMQLFSIGLYKRWPDGTLILDSKGNPLATYTQAQITGAARVFTGWNYGQSLVGGRLPTNFGPSQNFLDPMILVSTHHELGSKILLDNVVLPPATVVSQADATTDPTSTYSVVSVDPILGQGNTLSTVITNNYDLNGLKDFKAFLDQLGNNPTAGPYVCRQLIQRLVTSNPTPDYLYRVVQAFNGERNVDGMATGVRGDFKEVIRAILLDYQARSVNSDAAGAVTFGKQREPLLRVTGPARAFPTTAAAGTYAQAEFASAGKNSDTMQLVTITTGTAHKLANGDVVQLTFSNPTTGPVLSATNYNQQYTARNVTTTTFTINPSGISVNGDPNGDYIWSQSDGGGTLSGTIVTVTASGYFAGNKVFLKFVKNGAITANNSSSTANVDLPPDGSYTVVSGTGGSSFTVNVTENGGTPFVRTNTGNRLLIPKFAAGYSVLNNTGVPAPNDKVITIATTGNHEVNVNDQVQIDFPSNVNPLPPADGVFTVKSIVDSDHFTVWGTGGTSGDNESGALVYPLVKPALTRVGSVNVQESTYKLSYTNADVGQTPLDATTVFNFFYPDFQYPGSSLLNSGLTVPEFQLTGDTNTMNLQNFIYNGIYISGNTNGLTSFRSGGGAIMMDFSPYMTSAFTTSGSGVGSLVDALNNLLCGGRLSANVKTQITNYVVDTNFPTGNATNLRDRVRAVIYLIISSDEYAIQR